MNIKRKLASIREVLEVIPIPDADKIELVKIDGWQCVTSKEERWKVGDRGVYIEIDSFLPVIPEFEFLRASSSKTMIVDGEELFGFRVKSMSLRKTLSQGLFIRPSHLELPEDLPIGTDVTERLGIRLYEPPIPHELSGTTTGPIPSVIRKTDEERIQNLAAQISDLQNDRYEATEKIDGTSATYHMLNGTAAACGRNWCYLQTKDNTFWKIANELNIFDRIRDSKLNIAIQGELVGPGIQGNYYKLANHRLYVFNIWHIDEHRYLTPVERMSVGIIGDGVLHAPILDTNFEGCSSVEEYLEQADGMSQIADVPREGVVFKSNTKDISFKVISNKWLLKQKG